MFILYTKINNEQKRTKKPKNGVQYEHIEHNVHSGHPVYLLLRAPQASVITAPPPRIIHPPPHLFEFIINKNMLPLSLNT